MGWGSGRGTDDDCAAVSGGVSFGSFGAFRLGETGTVLDKGRGDNFCLMFWPLSLQLFPYAMKPTGRHSTYPCTRAYSSTPGGRVMGDRAGRGNNGAAFLGTAKRRNQWKMSMSDDSHYVAGG
jgi:hypothetical protein